MDEICKYLIKKINISIAILFGTIVTGMLYLLQSNFNLFLEIDIIKFVILSFVITIPTFLITFVFIFFGTIFEIFTTKNHNVSEITNKILYLTSLFHFIAYILYYIYISPFDKIKNNIININLYYWVIIISFFASISITFYQFLFYLMDIIEEKKIKNHYITYKNANIEQ